MFAKYCARQIVRKKKKKKKKGGTYEHFQELLQIFISLHHTYVRQRS